MFRENAGNSNISSSIKEIYSSIGIESKVQSAEEQTKNEYLELLKKKIGESSEEIQEHLKRFSEVKDKLQNSTRGRRSSGTIPISHLSKAHRVSLGKMYSLHHGLKEISGSLYQKLQSELNGQVDFSPFANSITTSNISDIEKALKDIGWEESYLKAHKNKSVEDFFDPNYWGPQRGQGIQRRQRSVQFFNSRSWKSWLKNPFRNFYSSEPEFIQAILTYKNKAIDVLGKIQEEAKTNRRNQLWGVALVQDPTLKHKLAAIDSHITQKIALFLLESMNV